MAKRTADSAFGQFLQQSQRTSAETAAQRATTQQREGNKYLRHPVKPDKAIAIFLTQARSSARNFLPKEVKLPVTKPFCEVEARIGILKTQFGTDRRVTSSGAKHAHAFECTSVQPPAVFESGVTRSHYVHWTSPGLSEQSPISHALGVEHEAHLKRDLREVESVETVYAGYKNDVRVAFAGVHPSSTPKKGKTEYKDKLATMDVTLPAAPYDLRMTLSAEKVLDEVEEPPPGWTMKRIKRRKSYTRRDGSRVWQLDVTEVTTTFALPNKPPEVTFEIEMELNAKATLQLVNEENEQERNKFVDLIAKQLWWMLYQINPLSDVLDVENYLREHPDKKAVQLALAQCGALKKFMDSKDQTKYSSPIATPDQPPPATLSNLSFMGCMPVNFSRHNIEEVQRSPDNGYFLSEKTDGVRHIMVFTGKTVVLVDRAMKGYIPVVKDSTVDPYGSILSLIQPGTVFDGEVVMNRELRRPVFIVFDVLAISTTEPVLHLPFEQRLNHLKKATFRTKTANRDMFAKEALKDPKIALPLVRKNFVKRTDLDDLLSHVVEERGLRSYRNGTVHNHLTDGIIFQPNTPYVCGTDHQLLKWKYLDTVTIDVEIMVDPMGRNNNNDDDQLRVAVLGEEGSMVDMSRYVKLPTSELRRLEADRAESRSKIAEVGFDASTGEWYYLTMRPDKVKPNHISTVLGTLLELAESLTTEELRYRMSVPSGGRDTYSRDARRMQRQLLEHQRQQNRNAKQSQSRH